MWTPYITNSEDCGTTTRHDHPSQSVCHLPPSLFAIVRAHCARDCGEHFWEEEPGSSVLPQVLLAELGVVLSVDHAL
jgi:hypothetical protein